LKIEIESCESIERRANKPWGCAVALISIADDEFSLPMLRHNPAFVLRMLFEDIGYEDMDDCGTDRAAIINDGQAKQIAGFVAKVKDKVDLLICQCEHGQSRSAATAAAIMQYLYGDGINIFADSRYYPNKLIYHKVFGALNGKQ
jgi:predicted protein tyrosine phosphatase